MSFSIRKALCVLGFFATSFSCTLVACPNGKVAQYGAGDPIFVKESLKTEIDELCFKGFTVIHSGVSRTPLLSAEHLTRERIAQARGLVRVDSFHPEASLPKSRRAEIADYRGSGFDRGHMAPNGDMSDAVMQGESFSLANMIPQNPNHNRNLWEGVESSVRGMLDKYDDIYVVTGPAFIGENLQRIGGRVLVPTHVFKAVYVPALGKASAYWTENKAGMTYEVITLAQLTEKIGIDVFPTLSEAAKHEKINLPKPKPHGNAK